ncbi:MAG TPA: SLC13 family permease [Chiayiivirga sp.]|nr:SLC13 family permease [Chiayiivirga sp.]
MTIDIALVLLIALASTVLFLSEKLRMDLVAMLVLAALAIFGLVTPTQAISGFSNQATITVAAMFVLAAGLQGSGSLSRIGHLLSRGRSPWQFLLILFGVLFVVGPFVNNTAIVAVFIPIVISACAKVNMPRTKALIPLSFVTQMTGVCTLIGTSTNLIVNGMAQELGHRGFSMFEFLPLGVICLLAGCLYLLLFGRWLLPGESDSEQQLYETGHFVTELRVGGNSTLLGKTVEAAQLNQRHQVYVLELWREGARLWSPRSETLREDDVLLIRGQWPALEKLQHETRLALNTSTRAQADLQQDDKQVMVEVMIAPNSVIAEHRLAALDYRLPDHTRILGVQRRDQIIREKLGDIVLQVGDILLLILPESESAELRRNRNIIVLSKRSAPRPKGWRTPFALAVMASVVVVSAMGWVPITIAAILGAVAMVMAGCVDVDTVYESIDWRVLLLMAGLLPLGIAMSSSGAARFIVDNSVGLVSHFGPHVVLAVLYLMALLLSELMSNSASAILLTPIGVSTAHAIGVDATPFLIAVTFSASTSFLTPIGYQTNTMVHSAGGYQFMDFVKVGLPLNLIFWVLGVIFIPIFWPF